MLPGSAIEVAMTASVKVVDFDSGTLRCVSTTIHWTLFITKKKSLLSELSGTTAVLLCALDVLFWDSWLLHSYSETYSTASSLAPNWD